MTAKGFFRYGLGALALVALAFGLKSVGAVAQGGASLPLEVDNAYIRNLAAKARAEGGVIRSYGMPNDWANYGEIFAEFQRLFGIRQQDIDMGSAVVRAGCGRRRPARTTSPTSSPPSPWSWPRKA